MHYLKCDKCGHLNPLHTEGLLFCSACKKKLGLNFSDWHRRNRDKTFTDFQNLCCTTTLEEVQPTKATKNRAKKAAIITIISLVALLMIAVTGYYLFPVFTKYAPKIIAKYAKLPNKVLQQNWVKKTYGNYGLTIETPSELQAWELPIPGNIKFLFDDINSYQYLSNTGFYVMLNCFKYNNILGEAKLQESADNSAALMKEQEGVSDFDYTEDYLYKEDIPGIIQKGAFKKTGIGVQFINAVFAKELVLWQVMVAWPVNDNVGSKASNRIIKSIEIKRNK